MKIKMNNYFSPSASFEPFNHRTVSNESGPRAHQPVHRMGGVGWENRCVVATSYVCGLIFCGFPHSHLHHAPCSNTLLAACWWAETVVCRRRLCGFRNLTAMIGLFTICSRARLVRIQIGCALVVVVWWFLTLKVATRWWFNFSQHIF